MATNLPKLAARSGDERERQLDEVQLALAQAQKALAESFSALVRAQAARSTGDPAPVSTRNKPVLPHFGKLEHTAEGLQFKERDTTHLMSDLAQRGKDIEIGFTLNKKPTRTPAQRAMIKQLVAFISAHAEADIAVAAACGNGGGNGSGPGNTSGEPHTKR